VVRGESEGEEGKGRRTDDTYIARSRGKLF
jgi:hypothetical protein